MRDGITKWDIRNFIFSNLHLHIRQFLEKFRDFLDCESVEIVQPRSNLYIFKVEDKEVVKISTLQVQIDIV